MKIKYLIIILISIFIIKPSACEAKISTKQINIIKNKLSSLNSGRIEEQLFKTKENKKTLIYTKNTTFNKKENKLFIKKIFLSPDSILKEEYHVNINDDFYYKIKINSSSLTTDALLPTTTREYLNDLKIEKWNTYDDKLLTSAKDLNEQDLKKFDFKNSKPLKLSLDVEFIGKTDFRNSKDKINNFINSIGSVLKINDIKNFKIQNKNNKIINLINFKQPSKIYNPKDYQSILALANSVMSNVLLQMDWATMNDIQKNSFGKLFGFFTITKEEILMEKEQIKTITFIMKGMQFIPTLDSKGKIVQTLKYFPDEYTYVISFEDNNKPVNIYKPKDL